MKTLKTYLLFLAFLGLAPAPAAAVAFTDEAAFQAAAGGVVIEDFESYGLFEEVGALPALGISFAPFSNGSLPTGYNLVAGGFARSGTITLSNNDKLSLPGLGPFEILADPGTSFRALGYWAGGADDTSRLTLFDADDNIIESALVVDTNGSALNPISFIGIITTVDAVRALIEPVLGNGWFGFDDLQVGSITVSVHAPGALPLLFGVIYWLRRRSR